jgi:hypothetical protein
MYLDKSSSVKTNKGSELLLLAIIGLYFYLFMAMGIFNIGNYDDAVPPYFFVTELNYRNLSVLLIICSYFTLPQFGATRHLLKNKNTFPAICVFFILLINGIIQGNDRRIIFNEVVLIIHFVVGILLFFFLLKSQLFRLFLTFFVTASVVIGHQILSVQASISSKIIGSDRVFDSLANSYASLTFVLISYLIIINFYGKLNPFSVFLKIITVFDVFLVLYDAAIATTTRSSLLAVLISLTVTTLTLLVFSYSCKRKQFENRPLKLSSIMIVACFIVGILTTLSIVYSEWLTDDIFSNISELNIYKRFTGVQVNEYDVFDTGEERIRELGSFFDHLNRNPATTYLTGNGIGSQFFNGRYMADHPHVAIFTFLLRGGILLFTYIVYLLYLKIPWSYIKYSFLVPLRRSKAYYEHINFNKRSAMLTIFPGVLCWSIFLLLSGGISNTFFLGIGFLYGSFLYVQSQGIEELLS